MPGSDQPNQPNTFAVPQPPSTASSDDGRITISERRPEEIADLAVRVHAAIARRGR